MREVRIDIMLVSAEERAAPARAIILAAATTCRRGRI